MKTITQLFLLFALARFGIAADFAQTDQDDNIREVVVRYQFGHNISAQQQHAQVYFLCLEKDRDLSEAFMKRIATHKPPVRICSAAKYDERQGVLDKHDGQRGITFRMGQIN